MIRQRRKVIYLLGFMGSGKSTVGNSLAAALGWPVLGAEGALGELAVDGPPVTVTNPLSERHAVLRSGLVGSLLDVLALNERHGRGDVAASRS